MNSHEKGGSAMGTTTEKQLKKQATMESPSKKELIESILRFTHRERDYEYRNLLWNYYPYNDLVLLKEYHERRKERLSTHRRVGKYGI